MHIRNIMLASCGEDSEGFSKAAVAIKGSEFNFKTETENVIFEEILEEPVVNIFRSVGYSMVDLTFKSEDLDNLWEVIERMQAFTNARMMPESEDVLPTVVVTIIPKEYDGEYYLSCMNAMWCIQPSVRNGEYDTLRFIVANDFFHGFRTTYDNENEDIGVLNAGEDGEYGA